MVIKKTLILLAVSLCCVAISGCSGKNVPDEFMVLKNRPLSMPPDFHLTPDGPYSDLDEIVDPQEIAKQALFGEN